SQNTLFFGAGTRLSVL
ncbi:rCG64540, partial [Rattus norvegicus]